MKSNTITLIIVTGILAAAGYWYFSSSTGNQSPLTASGAGDATQAQFDSLVSELQSISFDISIFSDSHFIALVDLSTPVLPESSGRIDPFGTVPGVIGH